MADSSFKPLEFQDFSGGITDHVFNQDYTRCKFQDNLNITDDIKLSSRDGSEIDNDTPADDQIPAGIQRVGTFINYANNDNLFVHSAKKIYWRDPASYATLTGPTGNDVFSSGTTANIVSHTQWNKHIFLTNDSMPRPMKIFKDDGGDYQVRTSGLPRLATSPTVTAGAAGTNDYIYAFHFEYTYMVGDQTFQDVGAITEVELLNSGDPGAFPNSISAIPVLSNGLTDNWDTATIRIFIFRTIAGGTDFYQIGTVTNGTTVFSDTFSDTTIQDNDLIYTADGTVEFDPVPESKFVHVINNTGYYGYINSGSEGFPFTGRQSIPGDPDSVPEPFEFILEDEIKGISSAKSVPIYLCRRHIYRIEGFLDQFGRGSIQPVRISDTAGCISNQSVVQCENGIFWAGVDGFYFSDGYQVLKISNHLNTTYKQLLAAQENKLFIQGEHDLTERRIIWAAQFASSSLDNDGAIVLDLRKGVSPEMPFWTWSGDSFRPSAFVFFNDSLYRGDTRGYVFIHDPDVLTDPKVDTASDAEDWNRETIIWEYKSININFGSTFFRKLPSRILLTAQNTGNTSIQINAINDDGKSVRALKIIRWRRNFTWGDDDFSWGSPDCVWNSLGVIEQWRRFPARPLRLSYLQVQITNGYSIVTNSDASGTATFNGAANTATLDNALTADWPADVVDYKISTEVDDYAGEFLVSVRTSNDVITVIDPNNALPTGSFKWVLRGFKKDEPLSLLSYNLFWNDVSQSQMTFQSGDDGGNV